MSEPRADVALLVDFTDLRNSLCPEHRGQRPAAADAPILPEGGGEAPVVEKEPEASDVARALVRFAGQVGRVAVARAYADWTHCGPLAHEVSRENLEPILVPGTPQGEDRSHIRLVVDALETLFCGDEPDAFVLVTGDSTLLPLVQRLKADGSQVILVAPSHAIGPDLKSAADCFFPIEDVLRGAAAEPANPRTWRGARAASTAAASPARVAPEAAPERPPHPTPVTSDGGFDRYNWRPFIQLVDELEHRLPFVGVRYLVNKVLGPHNCGVDDARLKRDLINRAVEDQLIEMYPVGNVGDRADPVTACRLNRACEVVVTVLGTTSTPSAPAEHAPGALGDDDPGDDDPGDDDPGDGPPDRGPSDHGPLGDGEFGAGEYDSED